MRLRNQLFAAGEAFSRDQNMPSKQITTMSKDMDGHLKFVPNLLDVVGRPNRMFNVTLLLYKVDKPLISNAGVRKKEEENFQQLAIVNYDLSQINFLGAGFVYCCRIKVTLTKKMNNLPFGKSSVFLSLKRLSQPRNLQHVYHWLKVRTTKRSVTEYIFLSTLSAALLCRAERN